MIEAKEFECGGVRYKCTMFGAEKGQTLMVRIVKLVGPSVARGLAGLDDDVAIGPAIEHLCVSLTPALFNEVAKDFAEQCTFYDTAEETWKPLAPSYNGHFAGRYMELLEWLKGCFEVNYAGFFDALIAKAKAKMKAAAEMIASMKTTESPSPVTSTGVSTG